MREDTSAAACDSDGHAWLVVAAVGADSRRRRRDSGRNGLEDNFGRGGGRCGGDTRLRHGKGRLGDSDGRGHDRLHVV